MSLLKLRAVRGALTGPVSALWGREFRGCEFMAQELNYYTL